MTLTTHALKLANNRLEGGVDFHQTPNGGSPITPRFIVLHYTAGTTSESAVQTFLTPSAKVSAHLVVDRDGSVVQMQDFNKSCWHAGPSKFAEFTGLNNHSIGIEMVNGGFYRKVGDGFVDWAGRPANVEEDEVTMIRYQRAGSGNLYWMEYTQAQLDAVEEIVKLLISKYPIKAVVSHEEIDTRGWKTDPGPAFPMMRFKTLLDDRADGATHSKEAVSKTPTGVTTASLKVRSGPSAAFPQVALLYPGSKVEIYEEAGGWMRISNGYRPQWVSGNYVRKT